MRCLTERALTGRTLAIVYTGLFRTIYTNGVAASSSLSTAIDIVGSGLDDLLLGAESDTKFSAFGALDDFRIYNYALASEEIAALVNLPIPLARLSISASATELTISWPVYDSSQFRVESNTELGGATAWSPVSAPIEAPSAGFNQIRIPVPASTHFLSIAETLEGLALIQA